MDLMYYHLHPEGVFPTGLSFHGSSSSLLHDLQTERYGIYINSEVCRAAILVQATILKDGTPIERPSQATMQHLDKFYKECRKAIDQEEFADVVYAAYTVYQCATIMSEPTSVRASHASGLVLAYKKLKESKSLTEKESVLMFLMCYDALEMLSWPDGDAATEEELWVMYEAYRKGLYLIQDHDIANESSDQMQSTAISVRMSMLIAFQEIYFSNYFASASRFLRTPMEHSREIATTLSAIIEAITDEIAFFINPQLGHVIANYLPELPEVNPSDSGEVFFELPRPLGETAQITADDLKYSQAFFVSSILRSFLPIPTITNEHLEAVVGDLCRLAVLGEYLRVNENFYWGLDEVVGSLILGSISLSRISRGNQKKGHL